MTDRTMVNVADKVRAFREDHPITELAILTSFAEDEVEGQLRVIGCCKIILCETGQIIAEAYGTRALRRPLPGKQGMQDTRDPDRAMTQAVGRALGLLGYADGTSLEGDTDEPDSSNEEGPTTSRSSRRREGSAKPATGVPQGSGDKETPAVTPGQQKLINRVAALPLEKRTLYLAARKEHVPPLPPIQDCNDVQLDLVAQLVTFYETTYEMSDEYNPDEFR